jgi:biopolymer transport protein TolR
MGAAVSGGGRGGHGRRGKRGLVAEMNVVPYIDVTLVLLIIFMITAPLVTQGVKVDLPKTTSEVIPTPQAEPVIVTVARDGRLYLTVGSSPEEPVDEGAIRERVATALRAHPQAPVLVRGDSEVPYGKVIGLMAALQQGGVSKVGLLTEAPDVGGSASTSTGVNAGAAKGKKRR